MTAFECVEAFGWPVMAQLAEAPVALFALPGPSVSESFAARRKGLGISVDQIADRTGIEPGSIEEAESGHRKTPMPLLTRLAQVLAFDYWTIGREIPAMPVEALAHKLRRTQAGQTVLDAEAVLDLLEAASIIATQARMEAWLRPDDNDVLGRLASLRPQFMQPTTRDEAWRQGANLAHHAREVLGFDDRPISDLADMIENRLAIPVVRMRLDEVLAGATIRNGSARGILVNLDGINVNPGTRRVTLAHELCHALWETDRDLEALRLEWSEDLWRGKGERDPLEDRAQAFAAEFLAPAAVVSQAYLDRGRTPEALHHVMRTFGISLTCARIQIRRGAYDRLDRDELNAIGTTELVGWSDADVPPIDEDLPELQTQRSGRFLEICREAYEADLIEVETISDLLEVSLPEAQQIIQPRRSMDPRR